MSEDEFSQYEEITDEEVEEEREIMFFKNLFKYISKIIYDDVQLYKGVVSRKKENKRQHKVLAEQLRGRLWLLLKGFVHLPTNITVKEWFLRRIEYPYAKRLSKRQLVNKRILEFIANKGKLISVEDYKKCYLDQYWGYMNHENGCDDFLVLGEGE